MDLESLCRTKWFLEWQGTLVDFWVKFWNDWKGAWLCWQSKNKLCIWADAEPKNFIFFVLQKNVCADRMLKIFFLIKDALLALIPSSIQHTAKLLHCCILFPTYNKGNRKSWQFLIFRGKHNDEYFSSRLNVFLSNRKASPWSRMNLWKLHIQVPTSDTVY